jgi:hypothetical protein
VEVTSFVMADVRKLQERAWGIEPGEDSIEYMVDSATADALDAWEAMIARAMSPDMEPDTRRLLAARLRTIAAKLESFS